MAIICAEHASVVFPIYGASNRSVKTRFLAATTGGRIGTNAKDHVTVQALEDVTLTVQHGERLALVGPNGAGKTTLLRLIAGIYDPVAGRILVEGKIAALFDVSGGMDPDSTGWENITLRGLYLGLSKQEIRAKTEEIAEFTELGSFLNMPLRTYSTGMQARLAFALSSSIEPEILLIDEGIGAGDAAFIRKIERRFAELIQRSGILVLASHAEQTIRRTCTKAVLLDRGAIIAVGSVDDVLARYAELNSAKAAPVNAEEPRLAARAN